MFTALLGVISPILSKILDKVPDAGKKAEIELEFQKLLLANESQIREVLSKSDEGQVEINKIEAASESKIKSLWRPVLAWVLVTVTAIQLLFPFVVWALKLCNVNAPEPPPLNSEEVMFLLPALLGLAGTRSFDKSTAKGK